MSHAHDENQQPHSPDAKRKFVEWISDPATDSADVDTFVEAYGHDARRRQGRQ